MFDTFGKHQKIIIYMFIAFSFILIIPLFFWIGFFIGHQYCKHQTIRQFEVEQPLESEPDMNDNILELKI